MSDKLLIVESPNKIKKIKAVLGPGWNVMASVGHIRDLPEKGISVAPPDYKPTYVVSEGKQEVVEKLCKAAAIAESIWLATDPDREGESIAWHLSQALGLKKLGKPVHRVTFHAITEKAVKEAVAKPGQIDIPMVSAQEARRVIDRLVGYKVSPAIGRSAGRVQSPAVRIVVEREIEIEKFKPVGYFEVEATLDGLPDGKVGNAKPWKAKWDFAPFLPAGEQLLKNRAAAEIVAEATKFKVLSSEVKKVAVKPPAPFTTSTLQQAASVALGLSPEESMKLAQNLFAAGHITYHRTDSQNLSVEGSAEAMAWIRQAGLPVAAKQNTWASREGAQEAHEAIRPAHFNVTEAGDTPDERKLYQLIWKRAVASQMADAICEDTKIVLESDVKVPVGDKSWALFKATGRVLTEEKGWRTLVDGDSCDENNGDGPAPLPRCKPGETYHGTAAALEKKTRPPPRYTEASLVKKLESMEIGRPSTYASIMANIKRKGYILVDTARKLHATEDGKSVIACLLNAKFSFVEYGYTKGMEAMLDAIHEKKATYLQTVAGVDATLDRELQAIPASARRQYGSSQSRGGTVLCQCQCGGDVVESPKAYQCNGECKSIVWKESYGGAVPKGKAEKLFVGETVHLNGLVSKDKKTYSADARLEDGKLRLLFNDNKTQQDNKDVLFLCECGGDVVESPKAYQCKGNCKAIVWKESFGGVVPKGKAEKLFAGETVHLDGLVSKVGKPYSADAKLEGGKVKLIFDGKGSVNPAIEACGTIDADAPHSAYGGKTNKRASKHIGECQCGGSVMESDKAYECDQCNTRIWKETCGTVVGIGDALELFSGRSVHWSNLKSSKGNFYSADFRLVDGKIKPLFLTR